MNSRITSWLAWLLCALIVAVHLFGVARAVVNGELPTEPVRVAAKLVESLLPFTFALVGALILSRQARNVIGWLLIVPALAFALSTITAAIIGNATTAPAELSFWLYLALYVGGVGWVFFIFPLFLIAQLFPTGKPVSPRWRWAVGYALGLLVFFLVVAAFIDRIGPLGDTGEMTWSVPNPIGFITRDQQDIIFGLPWSIALGGLTLVSAASVIVRYRRAGLIEREQMKWLLFAVSLFAAAYIPGVFTAGEMEGLGGAILNVLFLASTLAIPIAIGIAILRYRLFDIDVIIRRTLTYALVVALLGVVYFGSVILLQRIFAGIVGDNSEIVTVLSTLAIAALFVPLRNRIQNAIDKRFNRQRYNAQQVLQKFAETVRDETDLEKLTSELVNVVNETMQPKTVNVWLKRESKKESVIKSQS
jgi:hypothetical protein